jgi:tetratricopeptide (TPR) repeat protein
MHVAVYYNGVGYFKRAKELFKEMMRNDPLNQEARGHYLLSLYILGDTQRAEEEYKRGKALFGDQWLFGDWTITFLRLDTNDVVSSDDVVYSDKFFDAAKKYFDSPQKGIEEFRRLYANYDNISTVNLIEISLWTAYFGDPEFAMDMIVKAVNVDHTSGFHMWWPTLREVRQTPRFKQFVREIGLVDYWNKFGWPDICHQLDNGDFECE